MNKKLVVVLSVLDTGTCRVTKAVVCVSEVIVALIPIQGFFNPPRKSIWLSVDHRRLIPIEHMIFSS